MLPRNHPDRIQIAFDDPRLVANAGLLLPVTLAQHLGLREVVDSHVDLGDAPGRANPGDKLLTLVASALAGGDFIDDADVLRTGGTAGAIGCVVKAPSTLGTFLRSFRWGHVRQLDRVSRELLSRAWAAGTGPGEGPLTIDLDSTMCETYGLAKEGARHHGYTGQRGYHPLLAIAAGTGEVLMSRLREGRANTARGAAHFLRETVGRVRHAGARGQLTVRADSGFYAHALVVVCREMDVRFSITIRQHARLRELIEAIPEEDWTPVPYWMDGGADVAETTYMLLTLLALVIVIGIQAAGIVLVMAMLITPAATAYLLARRFVGVMFVGALIGAVSAVAGLYLSFHANLPSGPAMALVATGAFGIAAALKKVWPLTRTFRSAASVGAADS